MIESLKIKIEEHAGFKILTQGDCHLLSKQIKSEIKQVLSYNTIRRFFNLADKRKTSRSSLDILSKYIGYKDFSHFNISFPHEHKWSVENKLFFFLEQNDSKGLLICLAKIKSSTSNYVSIISNVCREVIYRRDFKLLSNIFELDSLRFSDFTYNEVVQIGNSLGILLRSHPINKDDTVILLNNFNFIQCVCLIFVDYSNLNSYYFKWSQILSEKKGHMEIFIFSNCIIQLSNYLNKRTVKIPKEFELIPDNTHPILEGRILALRLIVEKESSRRKLLEAFHTRFSKNEVLPLEYFFELSFTALLINSRVMQEWIVNLSPKSLNLKQSYQHHNIQLYYLVCRFYFLQIKNKKMERFYSKKTDSNLIRFSYLDIIQIFMIIIEFHTDNSNKSNVLANYNVLTQKISYPIFTESYMLDYFSKKKLDY
tara:strand:- start:155 stop:1429 length:1275 start_codon:yes stop_codon:yes gene_type:complete